jgi:hypothetical protein
MRAALADILRRHSQCDRHDYSKTCQGLRPQTTEPTRAAVGTRLGNPL